MKHINLNEFHGVDAIFLDCKDPNYQWILGEKIDDSYILLTKKRKYFLKSPLSSQNISGYKTQDYSLKTLKKLVSKVKNLGVNTSQISIDFKKTLHGIKLTDIRKELEQLRIIKTNIEIEHVKIASYHTVKCFNNLIKIFPTFDRENDAVKEIKRYAIDNNLGLAFEPIIASGKNACVPHHDNKGKLSRGFCIIDMGFEYKGYNSDMSRTIFLGKPTKRDIDVYKKMELVQEELTRQTITGVKCLNLYKNSLKLLGDLQKYFIHGLGHGVGVEIHEQPKINKESNATLKKNMIVTIEPGIYIKRRGLGIRIEDTIVVDKKAVILTNATKKLIIIPKHI